MGSLTDRKENTQIKSVLVTCSVTKVGDYSGFVDIHSVTDVKGLQNVEPPGQDHAA